MYTILPKKVNIMPRLVLELCHSWIRTHRISLHTRAHHYIWEGEYISLKHVMSLMIVTVKSHGMAECPSLISIDHGIRTHGSHQTTNDLNINTCRFLARRSALLRQGNAQCLDNVTEMGDIG